jgi:outer membrane PBP1 activator LpoA protein
MKLRVSLVLVCLLFLSACAPEPIVRPVDPSVLASDEIAALIAGGDYEQALTRLDQQLLGLSDADRAGLQLRAAEQFLSVRRGMEARTLLDRLRPADLQGYDGLRLTMARAELALLDRDPETANWLLDQIQDQVPGSLQSRLQSLRQRLGQPLVAEPSERLQALVVTLNDLPPDPELALAALMEFPLAQLQALLIDPAQTRDSLPWIDLAASAKETVLDPDRLPRALDAWEGRHPDAGYTATQAQDWLSAWRDLQRPPQRIALLIPGPQSALARPGQALRNGILSSWLAEPSDRRPELMFFDVTDTPSSAVDAWYAARDADADKVIGPLARPQVERLLALGDASIPILLLNQPAVLEQLINFPGLATAFALNPEEEAELTAARALLDGHSRALILRQDSDWGQRVSDAFRTIFTAGDGEILREMVYPANQADYSILLEVMLELDHSERRAEQLSSVLGVPVEFEPRRRTDADLIFLAARADDARALNPQLKFFGAGDLPILTTSAALAGTPDPRRAKDLDGIVLPLSPWFSNEGNASSQRQLATRRYPDLDNPALSRLFAMGRDVFALLPWLDDMEADPDLYLAGMTGRLRLNDQGLVQRDLPFVRIVDGQAQPQ